MSAPLIPFDFETNAVRVAMREGAPWFVAADVCRVLEIRNPRQAVSRLGDDEKVVVSADTLDPMTVGNADGQSPLTVISSDGQSPLTLDSIEGQKPGRGGARSFNLVSESGLYALIFTSRTPSAERFRKWVTGEVLPAIRKGGRYSIPNAERREMDAKRAYLEALPEEHRALARRRAEVMGELADALEGGMRATAATRAAAEALEVSETSIWTMRRAIHLVPREDWEAALAPRWAGPRAMTSECSPEAMRAFVDLVLTGSKISAAYRRMLAMAAENGWQPIPEERAMRRLATTMLSATRGARIGEGRA